ncbi:ABC transporter substrate-binding protein, partial [Klebsiella pneumoniae]|uniref:ABC transporter substrate-binding protein n=1 Tax=Klebsiella pneumoniae TaxID=573 RepID=UPI0038533011
AWAPGVAIDLTAFPQTWHGAPAVTGLHYAIVPDAATALALYDSGAIDAMPLVDSLARATLADPRYDDQLFTTPRSQVRYLGLNQ